MMNPMYFLLVILIITYNYYSLVYSWRTYSSFLRNKLKRSIVENEMTDKSYLN